MMFLDNRGSAGTAAQHFVGLDPYQERFPFSASSATNPAPSFNT
jgi:hypothetical protein